MEKWIILDENLNYVMNFKTYTEAFDDAKQAARETGGAFSVAELRATITPEIWTRVDLL